MGNVKTELRSEIEKIILTGCLKKDNREKIVGKISEKYFFFQEHKEVFKTIIKLAKENNSDIDSLDVSFELVEKYPECITYLSNEEKTYESMKFDFYLKKFSKFIKQDILANAVKEAKSKGNYESTIKKALEIMKKIDLGDETTFRNLSEYTLDYFDDLLNAQKKGGGISGISSGFSFIDTHLSGLNKGNMIVLAGRTSMGKSTLASNIAENVARQGIPVLYFHLEAQPNEVLTRLLAKNILIDSDALKNKVVNKNEIEKIKNEFSKLQKIKFLIDFTPNISIQHFEKQVKLAKKMYPDLGLVVIDHLQRMKYGTGKSNNDAVADITRDFLGIIKELDVAGIMVSQFNRLIDRERRLPRLSDLRDSGAIEQDAHSVLFIERAIKKTKEMEKDEGRLYIAKNRNGRVGVYQRLKFYGRFIKYEEIENEVYEY